MRTAGYTHPHTAFGISSDDVYLVMGVWLTWNRKYIEKEAIKFSILTAASSPPFERIACVEILAWKLEIRDA